MGDVKITSGPIQAVDVSTITEIDLHALRERILEYNASPGLHVWGIGVVHALDDPEAALDSMSLGAETLTGFTAIHCLLCRVKYETAIRFAPCFIRGVRP